MAGKFEVWWAFLCQIGFGRSLTHAYGGPEAYLMVRDQPHPLDHIHSGQNRTRCRIFPSETDRSAIPLPVRIVRLDAVTGSGKQDGVVNKVDRFQREAHRVHYVTF
jgi:hypothetical protein